MILGNRWAQTPCQPTPICILWLPHSNKVCCEHLSTTNPWIINAQCKSNLLFASAARFCVLVLAWRRQLVLLRASSISWRMLAQSVCSSAARAWKSAIGLNTTPFTKWAMIAKRYYDHMTFTTIERSKQSSPRSQPSWMTTCLEWRRLKHTASVNMM
jgi:hypothetical protein